jgi:acyl-CoA thioester hydrolase
VTQPRRTATVRFTVPFVDVDAMGVVWHGNYLRYFDLARDRLLRDAGLDLYRGVEDGIVFPVTRMQAKHIRALRFRDEVDCTATLVEWECRLVVDFEIRQTGGTLCTKGRTEQVAVRLGEAKAALELRLPETVRRALAAPAAR